MFQQYLEFYRSRHGGEVPGGSNWTFDGGAVVEFLFDCWL
jgi:hypothetical protein